MWTICFLYLNELGLRHLIEQLVGTTASGNTFTGKVCILICDVLQDYVTNRKKKVFLTYLTMLLRILAMTRSMAISLSP